MKKLIIVHIFVTSFLSASQAPNAQQDLQTKSVHFTLFNQEMRIEKIGHGHNNPTYVLKTKDFTLRSKPGLFNPHFCNPYFIIETSGPHASGQEEEEICNLISDGKYQRFGQLPANPAFQQQVYNKLQAEHAEIEQQIDDEQSFLISQIKDARSLKNRKGERHIVRFNIGSIYVKPNSAGYNIFTNRCKDAQSQRLRQVINQRWHPLSFQDKLLIIKELIDKHKQQKKIKRVQFADQPAPQASAQQSFDPDEEVSV